MEKTGSNHARITSVKAGEGVKKTVGVIAPRKCIPKDALSRQALGRHSATLSNETAQNLMGGFREDITDARTAEERREKQLQFVIAGPQTKTAVKRRG